MTTASWRARLAEGEAPVYVRLVTALEADIASGVLPAGARLPTHRQLAEELDVGVGTVTRAYAEAESRGLITARVRRRRRGWPAARCARRSGPLRQA